MRSAVSRLLTLSAVLVLPAALVAGCGSTSKPSSTKTTPSTSSSLSPVSVTGDIGKTPTLKLAKTPFSVSSTVSKVITAGTGPVVQSGNMVRLNYFLVDGADGKEKDSTFGKSSVVFTADSTDLLPGLVKGLVNQHIGSRVLVAIPPADGFGADGNTSLGVGKNDSLLFVLDLQAETKPLTAPSGTTAPSKSGLPTVKGGPTATPTITLPSGAAPTKLVTQDLIQGTGAVVKTGQTISVNYVGVIWPGGKIFDSSYSRHQTAKFAIGQGQVIKGWDEGLVGQKIGSRVLLVIPPADGYGTSGNTQAGIKGSDTLVFVVDILGAI